MQEVPGSPDPKGADAKSPPPSSPPPRGPRIRLIVGFVVLVLIGFWIGHSWGGAVTSTLSEMWTSFFGTPEEEASSGDRSYYTCGMHPWVILPRPGDCPICHMELTPIDPAKFTGEISIDPRVVQSIGVRIEEVETGPLVRTIRTVGNVDYDERTVQDVNIKVKGWIEELYVDYLGAEVKKGQPLFDLFSRELYDTQRQYLLAFKNRNQKQVPFLPNSAQDPQNLLDSSRIRLEYYDITPQQIADLEKRGKPAKTMTIFSPYSGVVTSKHANKGMLVDPGMLVYRIADLSKVWVLVTLYEYQLPYVDVGQKAVMSLPYIPGQTFEGKVIYVYPYLDRTTREQQVRLEFDNPGLFLKPGMFTNIELRNTLARERVLAPRAAVIDTGERQVAFVSLGDGRFEPREVRMGVETEGGKVEILDGLKPGEMVVTSGQFLLDSEAKIREALTKMIKGDLASEQQAIAAVSGASELQTLPRDVEEGIEKILEAYFTVGEKLAADSTAEIAAPARVVAQQLDAVLKVQIPENPHFWHEHTEAATVRGRALELVSEKNLPSAREKFADLSVALGKLLSATGIPPSYGKEVQELHCPMYREGQGGGVWLQVAGEVRNPFYGSMMLRCFDGRVALPVTGAGDTSSTEKNESPTPGDEAPAEPVGEPEPAQDPSEHEREATPKSQAESDEAESSASALETQESIDKIVASYLAVSALLSSDSANGATKHLDDIQKNTAALAQESGSEKLSVLSKKLLESLPISEVSQDLKALREGFGPLSGALLQLVENHPPSSSIAPTLYAAHCPMAKANWLQESPEIKNPYYGKSMLRCGSVTKTLSARAQAEE